MDLSSISRVLRRLFPFLFAAALLVGCGGPPATSGYGLVWVTLAAEPGPFTAYIVTIDSITLTRNDGVVVTAIGTPEVVDFTQLTNYAEMWGSGAIPTGTYIAATITFDYTTPVISVLKNGVATEATAIDAVTYTTPSTYSVSVQFDPQNPVVITPTYASTSAKLVTINMNLAASNRVSLGAASATPAVYVAPFLTAGQQPPYTKPIRIRGPLINSSTDVQSYSVYVRPFYDEANNIGTVSMFTKPSTVWTINGKTYTGTPGLDALSVLSAGITMTAAWTWFEPDYNPANQAYAGTFYLSYVVGASTLEDEYTNGITGDVVARNGDTLTLTGATAILNTADTFEYEFAPSYVLLGPGTLVTADNNNTLSNLNANSIAVGQHITARGIYELNSSNEVVLDATGTSATNTGSVRLQPSELWGSVVSSASGALTMNVQNINGWPASVFDFSGNGATAPVASAFTVDTGTLSPPEGVVSGDPLWVSGYATPFGTAPPDFTAVALNDQSTVQVAALPLGAGQSGPAPNPPFTCQAGSQVCNPAVLQIQWYVPGDAQPFETFGETGFSIVPTDASVYSATVSIGPQVIDLKTLGTSVRVQPTPADTTLTFAPRYTVGDPKDATTTSTVTSDSYLFTWSSFADFGSTLHSMIGTARPAVQMAARGVYDQSTNTFTATVIDFVL